MLADYLCIEHCRGCGALIVPSPAGAMCACQQCWGEHSRSQPHIEACAAGSRLCSPLVASGTTYSGVLKKMIYRLKYDRDKTVVCDLIALTGNALELLQQTAPPVRQALLIPVPLHWMRLMIRGYNQAEMIAEGVGKRFGLKLDTGLLSRRRNTKAQHGLGKDERRQNIIGAFRVNRWAEKHHPPIVLVDDIYTSGATIAEAASALVEKGFTVVHAITAARATLDTGQAEALKPD